MNSKLAVVSLEDGGVTRFKIPARSPDINCIENLFNAMQKAIQKDAVNRKIEKENFAQFQDPMHEDHKEL